MNIEHKLEPIEHWIVDGKAFRLATEHDVGKLCYRSESPSFEQALRNDAPLTIKAYIAGSDRPFVVVSHWRYAYVQDDSLLTPQRTPVPALGDGWYLLTAEDGAFQEGDKVKNIQKHHKYWNDKTITFTPQYIAEWLRDGWIAARYFGPAKDTEIEPGPTEEPTTKPIDWTKPVRTKDGRAVRVLCTDAPGDYPIVGIIDGYESPETWMINGTWLQGEIEDTDLENAPSRIQREYWVNVYPEELGTVCVTKQAADEMRGTRCLACVKITIDCEEGEGL